MIPGYWIFFAFDKIFKNTVLYLEHHHTDLTSVSLDSSVMKQIHGKLVKDAEGFSSIKKAQEKITKKKKSIEFSCCVAGWFIFSCTF